MVTPRAAPAPAPAPAPPRATATAPPPWRSRSWQLLVVAAASWADHATGSTAMGVPWGMEPPPWRWGGVMVMRMPIGHSTRKQATQAARPAHGHARGF